MHYLVVTFDIYPFVLCHVDWFFFVANGVIGYERSKSAINIWMYLVMLKEGSIYTH